MNTFRFALVIGAFAALAAPLGEAGTHRPEATVLFNILRSDQLVQGTVNGLPCAQGMASELFCAPGGALSLPESEYRFMRSFKDNPAAPIHTAGLWVGPNQLKAVTFERGLSKPQLVLYWDKDTHQPGDSMKVYLRLPLHYTEAQFRDWCAKEGNVAWATILGDYQAVLDANPVTSSYRRPITLDPCDRKLMYAPGAIQLGTGAQPQPASAPAQPQPAAAALEPSAADIQAAEDEQRIHDMSDALAHKDSNRFESLAFKLRITPQDQFGVDMLLSQTIDAGNPQAVAALLEAGANPNGVNGASHAIAIISNPLNPDAPEADLAARKAILQELVSHGADLDQGGPGGLTVLAIARSTREFNPAAAAMIQPLIAAGAHE